MSVRFESIEDPADPAWAGHAALDAAPWWRRARVLAVLTLVGIGVVVLLVVLLSRGDDPAPRAESSTREATGIERSPVSAPTAADEVVRIPGDTSSAAGLEPAERSSEPTSGSGWAPVDATKDGSESGRITGDLSGTTPALRERLTKLAVELDVQIEFVSGWRTRHEQADLYSRFLAGTGNLAAVPGTSRHEVGYAADVYVDGVALADVPGARERARRLGLHFPVAGEAWHVELIETARM